MVSDTEIITSREMTQRVEQGEALPLLPEGVPGPVRLGGRWWAIPLDGTDYCPVADPDQVALLDRSVVRYAAARGEDGRSS